MPRMISEQEKQAKRRQAKQARRVESLRAQGYSQEDAKQVVGHFSAAKSLVSIAKDTRLLLGDATPEDQIVSVELGALEEMEKALVIASKHKNVTRELELVRRVIARRRLKVSA